MGIMKGSIMITLTNSASVLSTEAVLGMQIDSAQN